MKKIDYTLKNKYELEEQRKQRDKEFHDKYPMHALKIDYAFRHQYDKPELLEEIMQQAIIETNAMLDDN